MVELLGPSLEVLPREQELWVPPPRAPICDWAEANLFLPAKETTAPGLFSFYFSPFLREIAEACVDPAVSEVTIYACTQAGKTLISYLVLAYTIAVDPVHTMIVMPDESTVKRRIAARVRPIFEANPFLLKAIGGRLENLHIGEATVMDQMNLYLAWARSAAQLADVPVARILADEIGKFPPAVGKEADPLNLLRDRLRTFGHRATLIKTTSPVDEGDLADREYEAGDKRQFHPQCPHCSEHHTFDDRHMVLDKSLTGRFLDPEVYEKGDRARYVCPECGAVWSERDRHEAITAGRWAPHGCTVNSGGDILGELPETARRSYRISAFMVNPRFQSIGQLAAKYVRAQTSLKEGNFRPLQHWSRSEMARAWRFREKEPEESKLDPHIGSYERGLIPPGVQAITIGIDVQLDHIWYAVVGWGYLFEAWLLDEGRIETGATKELENFGRVRQLIARPWPFSHDRNLLLPTAMTGVDCGYEYDVVINFCRQNAHLRAIPVRGDDRVKARIYRKSPIDKIVARYDLNVDEIKNRLFRLLFEAEVPGPGYMHLHGETSQEVKNHLCSEEQEAVIKGERKEIRWVKRAGGGDNHLWDCLVYATAAAELVGVGLLEALVAPPMPAAPAKRSDRSDQQNKGFLQGLPRLSQ